MVGFDPSAFVLAGDQFCDPSLTPRSLRIYAGSSGYDGQFFYRFSRSPFTFGTTEYGITIDLPAYRQQRIVYPLAAWVLSLGRTNLVPAALLLANYAALCLLGWLAGCYVRALGRHALWALVVPLYPGFLLTLSRDLAEIVEVAFLLGGFLALRQGRSIIAGLSLTLAALTKETAMLAVVAVVAVELVQRPRRPAARGWTWAWLILPIVVFLAWQGVLLWRWGAFPLAQGFGNLGLPFAGLAGFVPRVKSIGGFVGPIWAPWSLVFSS